MCACEFKSHPGHSFCHLDYIGVLLYQYLSESSHMYRFLTHYGLSFSIISSFNPLEWKELILESYTYHILFSSLLVFLAMVELEPTTSDSINSTLTTGLSHTFVKITDHIYPNQSLKCCIEITDLLFLQHIQWIMINSWIQFYAFNFKIGINNLLEYDSAQIFHFVGN